LKKQAPIKYFKNLDGLRFLAALAVIMGHCQQIIANYQGYSPYEPYANKLASFGVDFFFVLSGFLISYLLMQEVEKTGTINIKNFYNRRFLRIWPLYFLVGLISVFFGSFIMNYFGFLKLNDGKYIDYVYNLPDLLKNLFFLGTFSINFQTLLGFQNPVSSMNFGHFWSLAIEEQFYLIWAPAMYFFRRHIGAVILVFLCLGFYFNHLPVENFKQYTSFHYNFTGHRFWYFGLGAAFAWWLQYFSIKMFWEQFLSTFNGLNTPIAQLSKGFKPLESSKLGSLKTLISSPKLLAFIVMASQLFYLIPIVNYLFGTIYVHTNEFVLNAIIALIIIMVAVADYSILSILFLENTVFKYLGKISYGIYIFHIFSIYLTYKILKDMGIAEKSETFYLLCPIVATLISIGLAALSYHFFESRFLKLKHKFS
jgi:peptidoglycan/LPS O-acetylase OafA/YrhL